jgi:hypothetical protein
MIQITVDPSEALTYMQRLSQQAPFAVSLALNKVANHAQAAVRDGIKRTYTLRREQFVLNTVKINREDRATKTKLDATVRIDPERNILAKFEEGGTKTARSGGSVAIPTTNVRRNKADILQKSQRPRALLDSKAAGRGKVFKTEKGIFQRVGARGASTVRALFLLRSVVRVRPTLNFKRNATDAVQRTWKDEMTAAFTKAEQTARG